MTRKNALLLARALNEAAPGFCAHRLPCYGDCDRLYCHNIFGCVHLIAGNIESAIEFYDDRLDNFRAWLQWLMKVRETR